MQKGITCGPKELPVRSIHARREYTKARESHAVLIGIFEELRQGGYSEEDIIRHINLLHRPAQIAPSSINVHTESTNPGSSSPASNTDGQVEPLNFITSPVSEPLLCQAPASGLLYQSIDSLDADFNFGSGFDLCEELWDDSGDLYPK